MPPASRPIASIFCDCRNCSSSCLRSVTSTPTAHVDHSGSGHSPEMFDQAMVRFVPSLQVIVSSQSRNSTPGSGTWRRIRARSTGSGMKRWMKPTSASTSSAVKPVTRSHSVFQNTKWPSSSSAVIRTGMFSTMACRRPRLARRASSASRVSLMSRTTPTSRVGVPSAARSTVARSCTHFTSPSGVTMRCSTSYTEPVSIARAVAARTRSRSSGWTRA